MWGIWTLVIVVTLKDAGGAAFEQALLRTPGRSGPVRVVSAARTVPVGVRSRTWCR